MVSAFYFLTAFISKTTASKETFLKTLQSLSLKKGENVFLLVHLIIVWLYLLNLGLLFVICYICYIWLYLLYCYIEVIFGW